jgi:hypothetical protein
MSGPAGKAATPNNQLVIYEPANWESVYAGNEIQRCTTTLIDPPAWLVQLFIRLQKAENDVKLLAEASQGQDATENNVTDLKQYYQTLSDNASSLFREISQSMNLQGSYTEGRFREIVNSCQMFGNDIWTTISRLRRDAEGKENVHEERTNRINEDLRLLKAGDDYWKTSFQNWAREHEQCQACLSANVHQQTGKIRDDTRNDAANNRRLLDQFRREANFCQDQLRREANEIMQRVREAERRLENARRDIETVYNMEIETLRNFHNYSEVSTLRVQTPGISLRSNGNQLPAPLPQAPTRVPEQHDQQPRKSSYLDYFKRVLRNLGGDSPDNRQVAIMLADKEMELEKASQPSLFSSADLSHTTIKRPTRKPPRSFDGELESDFTTWKHEVESYFRYYKKEFANEEDKISWIEGVLKDKALRWH